MGSRRLFRTDRELLSVIVRRRPPGPLIDVLAAEDASLASRPGVRGGIPGHNHYRVMEGKRGGADRQPPLFVFYLRSVNLTLAETLSVPRST